MCTPLITRNVTLHHVVITSARRSRFGCSLRTGWSGDWIPVEVIFSASIQTGPGAQPVSYTMDNGSFPGLKRPRRVVEHPPPSRAEFEGTLELYTCSPMGFRSLFKGKFTFTFPLSLGKSTCCFDNVGMWSLFLSTQRFAVCSSVQ